MEMSNEKIFDRVNECLDQHVNEMRGAIRQEPYIDDLFKLFAAAHARCESVGSSVPQITGDGLVKAIGERSHQMDPPERYQKKLKLLRKLGAMWDEWDYAWKMYPRFHQGTAV
jgi:hypothetical protein